MVNWNSFNAPVATFKAKRPQPGVQCDVLARQRAEDHRKSVERNWTCDCCRHKARLLFPVGARYLCIDCRDRR